MIRVPSPAKLNLFLHITGRRANGYHELQTIFQLIDLYDWMTFENLSEEIIQIEGIAEVQLEQNLIYRAAQLLRPHAKTVWTKNFDREKYSYGCWSWWWIIQCRNHTDCAQSTLGMRLK